MCFLLNNVKINLLFGLTLPSPMVRVQKSEVKVLSFGEDLGEAYVKINLLYYNCCFRALF